MTYMAHHHRTNIYMITLRTRHGNEETFQIRGDSVKQVFRDSRHILDRKRYTAVLNVKFLEKVS